METDKEMNIESYRCKESKPENPREHWPRAKRLGFLIEGSGVQTRPLFDTLVNVSETLFLGLTKACPRIWVDNKIIEKCLVNYVELHDT